jgi:hypothetical protein
MPTVKLGSASLTQDFAVADPVIGEVLTGNGSADAFTLANEVNSVLEVAAYMSGIRLIPVAGTTPGNAGEVGVSTTAGTTTLTFHSDVTMANGEKALVDYVKA